MRWHCTSLVSLVLGGHAAAESMGTAIDALHSSTFLPRKGWRPWFVKTYFKEVLEGDHGSFSGLRVKMLPTCAEDKRDWWQWCQQLEIISAEPERAFCHQARCVRQSCNDMMFNITIVACKPDFTEVYGNWTWCFLRAILINCLYSLAHSESSTK